MWSTGSIRSVPIRVPLASRKSALSVESRIERGDKIETERRSYISSRVLSAALFADAARSHWAIENNLHWTLDVTFNEDQSRLRIGHGAKHGGDPPLRSQSGAPSRGQAVHQAPPQARQLGSKVPARDMGPRRC
jgi:hypothetical protein